MTQEAPDAIRSAEHTPNLLEAEEVAKRIVAAFDFYMAARTEWTSGKIQSFDFIAARRPMRDILDNSETFLLSLARALLSVRERAVEEAALIARSKRYQVGPRDPFALGRDQAAEEIERAIRSLSRE